MYMFVCLWCVYMCVLVFFVQVCEWMYASALVRVCVCVQVCVWMYAYVCICTLWADSYMIHHFFPVAYSCAQTSWHEVSTFLMSTGSYSTTLPAPPGSCALVLTCVSVSCYEVCLTGCQHICQFVLVLCGCCAAVQFLKETSPLKTCFVQQVQQMKPKSKC